MMPSYRSMKLVTLAFIATKNFLGVTYSCTSSLICMGVGPNKHSFLIFCDTPKTVCGDAVDQFVYRIYDEIDLAYAQTVNYNVSSRAEHDGLQH